MRRILSSIALAWLCVTLGAPSAQTLYEDGIVAVVGETVITSFDIRREIAEFVRDLAQKYQGDELREQLDKLMAHAVQKAVEHELYYAEFATKGYQVPPSLVQKRLDQIVLSRTGGDRNRFEAMLIEQNMTMEEFTEKLAKNVAVDLMRDELVRGDSDITPVDIQTYYRDNADKFTTSAQCQLDAIVLSKRSLLGHALSDEVKRIKAGVTTGAEFASMADEAEGKGKYVDFGSFDKLSDLRKEFLEAIDGLKSGDIAEPVDVGDDVYLIRVVEKSEAGVTPLDSELRDRIKAVLRRERQAAKEAEVMADLKSKHHVQVFVGGE